MDELFGVYSELDSLHGIVDMCLEEIGEKAGVHDIQSVLVKVLRFIHVFGSKVVQNVSTSQP
jgi:hypothetical protein